MQPWELDVGRLGWGGVMVDGGHRNEYRVDDGVERCFFLVYVSEGWFICERR